MNTVHASPPSSPSGLSLLRRGSNLVKRIVPSKVYAVVHRAAIPVYRWLVRLVYRRKLILARLSGNRERLVRARFVHQVMPYSLVGPSGLEATYDAAQDVVRRGIQGCLVECGVAQGGSAALMGLVARREGRGRTLWLFDSYEGLPDPTREDYVDGRTGDHARDLKRGDCLGTVEQVSNLLFGTLGLDREEITLVKGWFNRTVAPTSGRIGSIALLRIDADWYESVKDCLTALYDQVVPGGYVIVDDYETCFGARKAVDEFLAARGLRVHLLFDGRGGTLFVKPGDQRGNAS